MQRSGVVAVNGPIKEVGPADDGTPPSNGLAEELYHTYAARSYSGSARRSWLGTEMLQDAGISMPEVRLDQAAKGLAASPVESGSTDIVSLMEATWCVFSATVSGLMNSDMQPCLQCSKATQLLPPCV